MTQLALPFQGSDSEQLIYASENYITRLMNSAVQERHVDPRWRYDGQCVGEGDFLEVNFTSEIRRKTAWPRDYCFQPTRPDESSAKPIVSVHADMANLAKRFGASVDELHSFMRFPPVRAVVRTLLIELENPEAQPGRRPDEVDILKQVDESTSCMTASQRQAFLSQTTPPGPGFADRALVLCVVKLYALFESWAWWRFGPSERRSTLEILMSIVGLFCNAWIHAPVLDSTWGRLGKPLPAPFPFDTFETVEPSLFGRLTPEIWLEWSLMYDPWIRRTDAMQLVTPADLETPTSPVRLPSAFIAEVSEPDAEKEGRVVVKYLHKPDEERWSFRAILDSKWTGKKPRTGLQYLVDWEYAEPTWQPANDLQGCDQWLLQFHRSQPQKAGPVPRLKRFL